MKLLVTKYEKPLSSGPVVHRERLLRRFDQASRSRLTVVAAAAGSGKTTLAVEWHRAAMGADRPLAWLALEPRDNEPERFWSYMIGALGQLGIDDENARLLPLPDHFDVRSDPAVESFLNPILNALAASPEGTIVVLDDFHHIGDPVIVGGIEYFIQHLPLSTHLVLLTRSEPALALETLRIRSAVDEIDGGDLRFTDDEVNTLFREVAGVELESYDTAQIQQYTEGWAAALKLAAVALRRSGDLAGLVAGLKAGSPRYLSEFLVTEVLDRQDSGLRSFLLESSVLGEFTDRMCDEITGRSDSAELARRVRDEHLFLQRLDTEGERFRYQPLFATMLRHYLALLDPARLAEIHGRASAWFEQAGELDRAVRHASDAADVDRVVDLVLTHAAAMVGVHGADETVRRWADSLRASRTGRGPRQLASAACALTLAGRPLEAAAFLDELDPTAQSDPELAGLVAFARLFSAFEEGAFDRILELTEHPLPSTTADLLGVHHLRLTYEQRGRALMLLDRDAEARLPLHQALTLRGPPLDPTYIIVPGLLAHLDVRAARLNSAKRWAEMSLQRAVDVGGADAPVTSEALSARAATAFERGDLESAQLDLDSAIRRAELMPHPWATCIALLYQSKVLAAGGLDDEAAQALNALSDTHPFGQLPVPIRNLVARAELDRAIRLGDAEAVGRWLVELAPEGAIGSAQRIASAIVLDGAPTAAALADGALEHLDHRASRRTRIEVNLAAAASFEGTERHDDALAALGRAATDAEPEGMVQAFCSAGRPVQSLLHDPSTLSGKTTRASPRFVDQLVAATRSTETRRGPLVADWDVGAEHALSDRESTVLRFLRSSMSLPEIADDLHVSHNTVKTHVQHIYRKLGTSSRAETVDRARDAGLLT